MQFLVETLYRFGSGSVAASMSLNGKLVRASLWERNSFWDRGYALVPLEELRHVRNVTIYKAAYPGGIFMFSGSGRQFVAQEALKMLTAPEGYVPRLGERGPLKASLLGASVGWSAARRERARQIAREGYLREALAHLRAWKPDGKFAVKGGTIVLQSPEHDPGFGGRLARLRVKEEVVAYCPV